MEKDFCPHCENDGEEECSHHGNEDDNEADPDCVNAAKEIKYGGDY